MKLKSIRKFAYLFFVALGFLFLGYLGFFLLSPDYGMTHALTAAFIFGPFVWGPLLILQPYGEPEPDGSIVVYHNRLILIPTLVVVSLPALLFFTGEKSISMGILALLSIAASIVLIKKIFDLNPILSINRDSITVRHKRRNITIPASDILAAFPYSEVLHKRNGRGSFWRSLRLAIKPESLPKYQQVLKRRIRYFAYAPSVYLDDSKLSSQVHVQLERSVPCTTDICIDTAWLSVSTKDIILACAHINNAGSLNK